MAACNLDIVPARRLPRSIRQRYTYTHDKALPVGTMVDIAFRGALTIGVVVASNDWPQTFSGRILPIRGISPWGSLTQTQLYLWGQLQALYASPEATALHVIIGDISRNTDPFDASSDPATKKTSGFSYRFEPALYPNSSKTKELLTELLTYKGQVLCLFPDLHSLKIASQTLANTFPVEVITGELTSRDRSNAWRRLLSEQSLLILGTRASLFFPFNKLSGIVIFYAHDDGHRSWDQQPTYDTNELTTRLARHVKIPIIVTGSTSPLTQPMMTKRHRASASSSATISIHDRRQTRRTTTSTLFDSDTERHLLEVAQTKRVLVYINRLGGGLLACATCQTLIRCAECQHPYALEDEARGTRWSCPRCLHKQTLDISCRQCSGRVFRLVSGGSQALTNFFRTLPVPLHRLDSRVIKNHAQLQKALHDIVAAKNGITVATSLVLSRLWTIPPYAETYALRPELDLAQPSWRANERVMESLTTLWTHTNERFVVDTAEPDHPLLQFLRRKDFAGFARSELAFRKRFGYPPFGRMVMLTRRQKFASSALVVYLKSQPDISLITEAKEANRIVLKVPPEYPLSDVWGKLDDDWKVDINPTHLA